MNHFSEYGIKKVVAIDDSFGSMISETTKIADMKEIDIDKRENLADFFHSNKDALISDFFLEENYDEDDKRMFLEEFRDNETAYYEKISSEDGISFLEWIPGEIDLKKNIENLASENERTFIILDKVLNDNPMLYKSILKETLYSISNVLTKNHNLFFVFFSSEPEKLENYSSVIDFLVNHIGLDISCAENLALHINFVDKKNYDLNSFISALRKSQKANFVNSLDEVYKKSIHTLKDRIWDINHNESLLHYDYLVEGQHIDAIIYDMFKSKFKYSFNEFRAEKYEELINPIRNSIQKYEKNRIDQEGVEIDFAPFRYRFLKEVNYAIHAEKMELKVSKSDDISYGNVIEIGDKMYLIISQNCDTTIRSNGKRKLKSFNLVEIKEKTTSIDIKWLKQEYISYFSRATGMGLSSNRDGREIFKGLFFSENESTELEKMGFKKEYLKQIEEANLSNSARKNLNSLKFDDDNKLSQMKSYEIVNSEIHTVPCFWLDALLLRRNNDGNVEICIETLEKSKEVRLATKIFILNELTILLEKTSDLSKAPLDIILANKLFNPIMPVKAIWENDALKGFELVNVTRKVRLEDIVTRKLHKKVIDNQVREAVNQEILI